MWYGFCRDALWTFDVWDFGFWRPCSVFRFSDTWIIIGGKVQHWRTWVCNIRHHNSVIWCLNHSSNTVSNISPTLSWSGFHADSLWSVDIGDFGFWSPYHVFRFSDTWIMIEGKVQTGWQQWGTWVSSIRYQSPTPHRSRCCRTPWYRPRCHSLRWCRPLCHKVRCRRLKLRSPRHRPNQLRWHGLDWQQWGINTGAGAAEWRGFAACARGGLVFHRIHGYKFSAHSCK